MDMGAKVLVWNSRNHMIFTILLIRKRYCACHAGVCGSGDM